MTPMSFRQIDGYISPTARRLHQKIILNVDLATTNSMTTNMVMTPDLGTVGVSFTKMSLPKR